MLRNSLLIILLMFTGVLHAANVVEGQQYTVIQPPVLTNVANDQIEVIEFFSYGCPHCATLEPHFADWEKNKPKNVIVKKVPVEFNPTWKPYVKLYYIADALNVTDKMTPVLFNAIQVKRLDVADEAVAEKLFVDQGVDAQKFKDAYQSRAVETKISQASVLTQQYKVARIPLIVVDGRYETNLGMAGGPEGLKQTLNFLISKVEEQRVAANKVTP
jgi:thiol:disulfide interchange protein DsbA